MTTRWRCVCAYAGTDFAGWQKQPSGDAVQDKIEAGLKEVFKRPVRTIGAGRTDAGVHAKGQVFHFDADWKHDADDMLNAMRAHFRSVSVPVQSSPPDLVSMPSCRQRESATGIGRWRAGQCLRKTGSYCLSRTERLIWKE